MESSSNVVFRRFGRAHHLRIADADDLATVLDLDEAHWVAISAPIESLRGDPTFLNLIDIDNDGRLRASDVEAAVRWLLAHLKDTTDLAQGTSALRLEAIETESADGKRIERTIAKMLADIDQDEANQIDLDQIRQIKSRLEATPVSEVGVVLPDAASDEEVGQFIRDIVAVLGGAPHPTGRLGVGLEQLNQFRQQVNSYVDWQARGQLHGGKEASDLYPLGDETAQAFDCLNDLRQRVDQYFAQCEALAFYKSWTNQEPQSIANAGQVDLNDPGRFLDEAPLSPPSAEGKLDLGPKINPHHRSQLEELRDRVLVPILGEPIDHLTKAKWQMVKERFAAYESWIKAKPSDAVAVLGPEKLQTYGTAKYVDVVTDLIKQREKTALQLDNVRLAEKLALFKANVLTLANNFVSFPHLYAPKDRAMFEVGSLIMDGRHFNMAVKVHNRAKHAQIAQSSNMFVLYVRIESHDQTPVELALPVTAGGKGNLVVGKRGIFVDVDGREWDAQVVQLIENPTTVGESIVAPFQRMGKLISGKLEQITGGAAKRLDAATQQTMTQVETAATTAETQGATQQRFAQNRGLMAGGLLAGGGLAVAALGSAAAFMTKTLAEVELYTVGALIGGALLAVILPTAIQASIKLRRRDLSALLEGSGWAINARMRLTRGLCRQFVQRPAYPHGAKGVRTTRWWLVLCLLVVVVTIAVTAYQIGQSRPQPAQPPATSPTESSDH